MWRIPSAPPGFFPLGKSLHGSEVMGAYFVSNVQFCEVYYFLIKILTGVNRVDSLPHKYQGGVASPLYFF